MSKLHVLAAGLLAAGFMVTIPVFAQDATTPTHEGPSVSVPVDQVQFGGTGIKTDAGELMAGAAYGNPFKGKHGTFVRMPAGFVSPLHTHTEDYFAVVIKGIGVNGPDAAAATELQAGSYWFQKGEEPHVTKCVSKEDCLFFIVQPGKFDYVPAK